MGKFFHVSLVGCLKNHKNVHKGAKRGGKKASGDQERGENKELTCRGEILQAEEREEGNLNEGWGIYKQSVSKRSCFKGESTGHEYDWGSGQCYGEEGGRNDRAGHGGTLIS